ncbi:hypothetical protein DFJ58DRAFT_727062 [Suillus subalutaceus]|uniref:uncharacterized protein n=1 Tax=Suillus subalutaceus TaxID=48586 RepID=UPI001B86D349|nr:uncharacterized protein DFJ58DRAFT_727062 [Suillus subalutaceus]KAG1857040.1 hypothetical protein DFJ58DRAFT_727062 [Suillus subalutaceus]
MAIQQKTVMNGPPKLIQPCIVTSKKSTNLTSADAPPAVNMAPQSTAAPQSTTAPQSTMAPQDNQTGQPVKKKHAGLKLNFWDSVDANRKLSNGGVMISTSDKLTLYYFDYICTYRISSNLKHVVNSDLEGPIPNWADKVASQTQLKPCSPPSAQASGRITQLQLADSDLDLDNEPEEYSEPTSTIQRGKNIVHVKEKLKLTSRGKKHSFQNAEYSAEERDAAEEFEMLQDPDTAEDQEILKHPDAAEDQEILEDPDAAEGFEEVAEGFEVAAEDEDHMHGTTHKLFNVSNQKTATQHTKGKGNTKVKTGGQDGGQDGGEG